MGLRAHDGDESQKNKSKWMWGCCGGCAGIGIVAAVGLGVFIYWMVRSQPVVPPETFFRTQSDALAVIQLRPEHHHLAELLQKLAEDPPDGMNMTEEQQESLQARSGDIPSQLSSATPIQLVLSARKLDSPQSIQDIPEGVQWKFLGDMVKGLGKKKRFSAGFAGSMKSYSGAISWTLSGMINSFVDRGGHKEDYKNVDIGVPPDESVYLAVVSNNFLLADDREVVRGWIDELHKEENEETAEKQEDRDFKGPPAVKSVYKKVDPEAPFIFATSNGRGEIGAFLTSFQEALGADEHDETRNVPSGINHVLQSSDVNFEAVKALAGYIDMDGPNTARIHLYAQCDSAQAADDISSELTDTISEVVAMDHKEGIEIMSEGATARIVITVENLEQAVRNILKQKKETDSQEK